MGGDGYRVDRKLPKTFATIRACAEEILRGLHDPLAACDLKKYGNNTLREAHKLLMFEGIIRRQYGFAVTERGKQHIATNGFAIYKPVKDAS